MPKCLICQNWSSTLRYAGISVFAGYWVNVDSCEKYKLQAMAVVIGSCTVVYRSSIRVMEKLRS